ncbi:MAG TPA: S-layer homology domain-containing protein [Candidatus Gracilibacteria bacterium]|nr:S-layer homology domain-containing protein [Candidatus Gracilibacteria bacterium]
MSLKYKIAALLAFALASLPLANAQSETTAATYLPATVDVLYEFNTNYENPLKGMIVESAKSGIIEGVGDGQSVDDTYAFIDSLFENNIFTVAMEMNGEPNEWGWVDPQMYISFSATDEELKTLMELTESATEEDYSGVTLYVSDDTFAANLYGQSFVTNKKEQLTALIDNTKDGNSPTLSEVQAYRNSRARDVENSFLSVYVNPAYASDPDSAYDPFFAGSFYAESFGLKPEVMEAVIAEGFSIAQVESGFDFGAYWEGDAEKLETLNLSFGSYNFVPGLYKIVSGEDIIFYSEQKNLQKSVNDLLNMFTAESELIEGFRDWKTWVMEETEISVDNDVLPLMSGKTALAVHGTDQIYPAFTLMFDVSGKMKEAVTFNLEVNNKLKTYWETLETETGKEFYTYSIDRVDGVAFYSHRLDVAVMSDDESLTQLPQEQTMLTLHVGIGPDSTLIMSSHPDLESILTSDESGMTDNEGFNELFTERSEEVMSVSYFSFVSLSQYLTTVMTAMEAGDDVISFVGGLLEPWNDMYAKEYGAVTSAWGFGTVRVDIAGFETYAQLFEDMWGSYEYEYPETMFPQKNFCDVEYGDWFYSYVSDLSSRGIVEGYLDGCFRPENEVTRAEFITMVMKANRVAAAINSGEQPFSDVPPYPGEWYSENVIMANMIGYIEGYSDGTFRPHDPITRAEAVKILYETQGSPASESDAEPFSDVNIEDWYRQAITWAYNNKIVAGVTPTTFEPNRGITRSEAAKIIDLTFPY